MGLVDVFDDAGDHSGDPDEMAGFESSAPF
jgi:hypothetical protein